MSTLDKYTLSLDLRQDGENAYKTVICFNKLALLLKNVVILAFLIFGEV